MRIDSHKIVVRQGYPTLVAQTEIGEMRIQLEQKHAERGLIHVHGSAAAVLPPIDLPADESNGQGPLRLEGFTADEQVVQLYREFARERG
jgi:predicted nucleotidyltransferase component of viral defense system